MVTLTVDGKKVKIAGGSTVLEAAEKLSISIPTLCHHESLVPYGGCRLCVVEVNRNGVVSLTSSCICKVEEGMKVRTATEKVQRIRRLVVALLLAESPEARRIQELAVEMGVEIPKRLPPRRNDLCILCARCIRACRELVGVNAIDFAGRGYGRTVASPFYKASPDCIACGTCVYICPTGAITMREVREGERGQVPGGGAILGPARIIDNWKVGLTMKRCEKCGEVIAPAFQLEYLRKKVNLKEDHFNLCPACRE